MALTSSIPRGLQRQIDLTTAVCQERLLATHVRHVLGFVDLVSDELPFDDALDIYVRILGLTPEQARNVGSRALASLGQRSDLPEVGEIDFSGEGDTETEPEAKQSGRSDAMFSRLRRRIRGRVQEDLRRTINLAAARANDAIMETHVANGLLFVKATKEEKVGEADAVELYVETMGLPTGLGDVVYNRALRTIADDVLPALPRGSRAADRTDAGTGTGAAAAEPGRDR